MEKKQICTKCGIEKELGEFWGVAKKSSACKKCNNKLRRLEYRTKDGKINILYSTQVSKSKERGHNPPEYTLQELKNWLARQQKWHNLFSDWEQSGYIKLMSPSIDRIDDYKGYSFDNIQLMTWEENKEKAHNDRKNGLNTKASKSILQFDLNDNLIKEWVSIHQINRETGIARANISACCSGLIRMNSVGVKYRTQTAGGYKWQYKENYEKNKKPIL